MNEETRLNRQQVAELLGISIPKLKRLVSQNRIHAGFSTGLQQFVGQSTRYWTYESLGLLPPAVGGNDLPPEAKPLGVNRLTPESRYLGLNIDLDVVAPLVFQKPVEVAPQYQDDEQVSDSPTPDDDVPPSPSSAAPAAVAAVPDTERKPLTDAEFTELWKQGKITDSLGNRVGSASTSILGPCDAVRDREAALRPPEILHAGMLCKEPERGSDGLIIDAGHPEAPLMAQAIEQGRAFPRGKTGTHVSPEEANRKHREYLLSLQAFNYARCQKEKGLGR